MEPESTSKNSNKPPIVIKSFLQSQIELIYSLQFLRDFVLTSSLEKLYGKQSNDQNLQIPTEYLKSFITLLKKIIYFQVNQEILRKIASINTPENIIQKELDTYEIENYKNLNNFDLLTFICDKITEHNAMVQCIKSSDDDELEINAQNFTSDYLIEQINYKYLKNTKNLIKLFNNENQNFNKISNFYEIYGVIFKKENYYYIDKDKCEDLLDKEDSDIIKKFFIDTYKLNKDEVDEVYIDTIVYKRKERDDENDIIYGGNMATSVYFDIGSGETDENKVEEKKDENDLPKTPVIKSFRRKKTELRK